MFTDLDERITTEISEFQGFGAALNATISAVDSNTNMINNKTVYEMTLEDLYNTWSIYYFVDRGRRKRIGIQGTAVQG